MVDDRMLDQEFKPEEVEIEVTLRPATLDEFIGQTQVKENLKVFVEAALGRQESLDHILLFGPPGLGKTTLANIIANKMNAKIHQISGPVLERAGDLAGILTNLEKG
ncbi:MAG: AAA family ATPase, partial [Candidatus Omnitrophota bacterium]